jgi:transcriptional regulator with XRE-family HTH domain
MSTVKTLNDKIVTIIEALGFSNTKFADAISVSRPTISHITSGRNRPSIDIVQKIIAQYPELGYKWFLDEEDFDSTKLEELSKAQSNSETEKAYQKQESSAGSNSSNSRNEQTPQEVANNNVVSQPSSIRRVEKIIMFYSDGSMEVLAGTPQIL